MALSDKIQDLSLKQIEIKKQELNILKTSAENVTLSEKIQDQEKKAQQEKEKSEKIQQKVN